MIATTGKKPEQRLDELEYQVGLLTSRVNRLLRNDRYSPTIMDAWAHLKTITHPAWNSDGLAFDKGVERLIQAVRKEERANKLS